MGLLLTRLQLYLLALQGPNCSQLNLMAPTMNIISLFFSYFDILNIYIFSEF